MPVGTFKNREAALGLLTPTTACAHKSLRVTPAMAAGVEARVWEIAELVSLLPKVEGKAPEALQEAGGGAGKFKIGHYREMP